MLKPTVEAVESVSVEDDINCTASDTVLEGEGGGGEQTLILHRPMSGDWYRSAISTKQVYLLAPT
jgi:hypothetical protein